MPRASIATDKRLAERCENIRQNGQRETIKLFSGQIVDGRNRFRACVLGNLAPQFETLDPATDPWAYVWSLNGERRDLTADQRYLIWKSCHEKSEAWESEKLRIFSDANRKRAEASKGNDKAAKDRIEEKNAPTTCGLTVSRSKGTKNAKANQKADASKTNRGSVERMDALVNNRPDLAEKVKTGEIKSAEAIREMKGEEIVAKLEDVKTKEVKAAAGVYDVNVMEPPWPMQKIDRDERQARGDAVTVCERLGGQSAPGFTNAATRLASWCRSICGAGT